MAVRRLSKEEREWVGLGYPNVQAMVDQFCGALEADEHFSGDYTEELDPLRTYVELLHQLHDGKLNALDEKAQGLILMFAEKDEWFDSMNLKLSADWAKTHKARGVDDSDPGQFVDRPKRSLPHHNILSTYLDTFFFHAGYLARRLGLEKREPEIGR